MAPRNAGQRCYGLLKIYFLEETALAIRDDCTVDATGSHERSLEVPSEQRGSDERVSGPSKQGGSIAKLRVGRHEKLVERKKLTRFGVYSIRFQPAPDEISALEVS